MNTTKEFSPSRTYIAICNKTNFEGYYLKEFVLPKTEDRDWPFASSPEKISIENTREMASWYFLNRLNSTACIETVILTKEEYNSLTIQG